MNVTNYKRLMTLDVVQRRALAWKQKDLGLIPRPEGRGRFDTPHPSWFKTPFHTNKTHNA